MKEKEREELYQNLEQKIESKEITLMEAGKLMGFESKRPDKSLKTWIENYRKKQHITHNTMQGSLVKQEVEEHGTLSVMQGYFNNEDNVKLLIEMIEERKNKPLEEEVTEIINTTLPDKYRKESNTQKSVRLNQSLFRDWEKALRKDHNLSDLSQSQLLNLTLVWAMEKIKKK